MPTLRAGVVSGLEVSSPGAAAAPNSKMWGSDEPVAYGLILFVVAVVILYFVL